MKLPDDHPEGPLLFWPSAEELLADLPEEEEVSAPEAGHEIIPGYLPCNEIHMLSGSSGAGKTTWMAWFVSNLQARKPIFGKPTWCPPFIAYVSGDRALRDAKNKFKKAGLFGLPAYGIIDDDPTKVKPLVNNLGEVTQIRPTSPFPIFDRALEALRLAYFPDQKRIPKNSLLIVDGMATVFNCEPGGKYLKDVAKPMLLLGMLCKELEITVFLVHHGSKQIADPTQRYARAQDRVLGSMALLGFTSTQVQITEPELTEDPQRGIHIVTMISHDAPNIKAEFRRGRDGMFTFVQMSADQFVPDTSFTRAEHEICQYLKDLPGNAATMKQMELFFGRRIPRTSLWRSLRKLEEAGVLHENDSIDLKASKWKLVMEKTA